jgi:serine/threonine-protein kinase
LYLAPETIKQPDKVTSSVDLYAIGAVGYFLLTGRPVFEGRSIVEICGQHLHHDPVSPSKRSGRDIPEAVERIILECLAKKPEQRPASAGILAAEMQACAARLGGWSELETRAWWQVRGVAVINAVRPGRPRDGASEARRTSQQALQVDLSLRDIAQRAAGRKR